MDRLPLIGGSYAARSIIANAQVCLNYYPEVNRRDSPSPMTHYQRPGFKPLVTAPDGGPVRCLYQATNGLGYAVIGNQVFLVRGPTNWVLQQIGAITPGRNNICSMIDNGSDVLLVDGGNIGWVFKVADGSGFSVLGDPSGIFQGADRVDYIDTFILYNMPGSVFFGSTHSNSLVMDPLFFAGKTDYPDNLQTLYINRHEILLFGLYKTEVWYNAGNPLFPFAELPGAYIEHGLEAKYSVASFDIGVFWLGQDLAGSGVVFRQKGYECKRISNHALEVAIRKMRKAGTIADAIGYTYQNDGHAFYVLAFPTGDQTWVYDDAIQDPELAWHQRSWTDSNGVQHRDRSNCYATLYGHNVVGDWQNGTLYDLDTETYTDTVAGAVYPITFIRTFPHLMSGIDAGSGNPVLANGRMVQHTRFLLDMQVGEADTGIPATAYQVQLSWSDDRGKTFQNSVMQSAGAIGEYLTEPQWRGVGQARDRVYQVRHSIPGEAALNGAWVMGKVLGQ